MRYQLSEIEATRLSATLRFATCETGIGMLVIHIHILKSRVLKSPENPPVKNRK
jgi:hypothetical protein